MKNDVNVEKTMNNTSKKKKMETKKQKTMANKRM